MTVFSENISVDPNLRSKKPSRIWAWLSAPAGLALIGAALGFGVSDAAKAQESRSARTLLADAKGWTYQLQGLDTGRAAVEAEDLLVIDYSRDGSAEGALRPAEVEALKLKADGERRVVVSYLSIGEAESYRYYWQKGWSMVQAGAAGREAADAQKSVTECAADDDEGESALLPAPSGAKVPGPNAPGWLHYENVQWKGNYYVRFWEPEWQRIIFGTPTSYLDRIIDAGFDGVYLDRADVYGFWKGAHATSEDDMVDFIAELSAYAKARNPDFLVILQNAEDLVRHEAVRDAIDSIAKEDLLFGIDHTETENCSQEVAASTDYLKFAQAQGKPIFVVEYINDPGKQEAARARISELGFQAAFASRELDGFNQ
ncbi:MAG TPA: endo alpha-1,4 polygalactosaminidase [Beijerinckiaceae bacterium]|nr:endo alpha-1,4 polygalactosaminidase [Beijerinckiaceae bacterium]